jgi:hypothetical protein
MFKVLYQYFCAFTNCKAKIEFTQKDLEDDSAVPPFVANGWGANYVTLGLTQHYCPKHK